MAASTYGAVGGGKVGGSYSCKKAKQGILVVLRSCSILTVVDMEPSQLVKLYSIQIKLGIVLMSVSWLWNYTIDL